LHCFTASPSHNQRIISVLKNRAWAVDGKRVPQHVISRQQLLKDICY
jgi:hypothetical protein